METDYPAAHSMSTAWFAVDAEGHVGFFYSSQSGAVPQQAAKVTGDLMSQLTEALPRGRALEDLQGRQMAGKGELSHCSYALPNYPLLMFVNSAYGLRDEIEAGRATQVQALDGLAFLLVGTSQEEYERLHAAGVCQGCFWDSVRSNEEPAPAELGLFSFKHPMSNVFSYPYARQSVPVKPIHVDQLPPQTREAVKRVALPVRFTDTLHIQPVELLPCESWESVYLDSTGTKLRPIPGKEAEYAGEYAEMSGYYAERYQMEPPPGQQAAQSEEPSGKDEDE